MKNQKPDIGPLRAESTEPGDDKPAGEPVSVEHPTLVETYFTPAELAVERAAFSARQSLAGASPTPGQCGPQEAPAPEPPKMDEQSGMEAQAEPAIPSEERKAARNSRRTPQMEFLFAEECSPPLLRELPPVREASPCDHGDVESPGEGEHAATGPDSGETRDGSGTEISTTGRASPTQTEGKL